MNTLTTGQRVRTRRTHRTGIVTAIQVRQDEDGACAAALVSLDPFVAHWGDAQPTCLTTIEGIYAIEDLEAAPPLGACSYPLC